MKQYFYLFLLLLAKPAFAQQYGYHYFSDIQGDEFDYSLKTSDSSVFNIGNGNSGGKFGISVMKTNAANDIQWYKVYTDTSLNIVFGAAESNDHQHYFILDQLYNRSKSTSDGMEVLTIDTGGNITGSMVYKFSQQATLLINAYFIAPEVQPGTGFIMGGVYDDGTTGLGVSFLIHCDVHGNVLWSKNYQSTNQAGDTTFDGQINKCLPDANGYFCMVSYGNNLNYQIGAIKVDVNGNPVWQKKYTTAPPGVSGVISRLRPMGDGTFLACRYRQQDKLNEFYWLNDDGTAKNIFLWQNPQGGELTVEDIVPATDTSFIAVGNLQDTTKSYPLYYYFIAKGDNAGRVEWAEKMFADTVQFAEFTQGQFFSAVKWNDDEYRAYGNLAFSVDIVADFDAHGEGLCKVIPQIPVVVQPAPGITVDTAYITGNNLAITATAGTALVKDISVQYDSGCSTAVATGITTFKQASGDDIVAYPNPATNSITITGYNAGKIQFFDLLGRNIATIQASSIETQVDVSQFPNVFFIRTESGAVKKMVRE